MPKYDPEYERKREQLTEERLKNGKFKVFGPDSRAHGRKMINEKSHIILVSEEVDVVLLDPDFELQLYQILKKRYE
jgi:hypothetical protein